MTQSLAIASDHAGFEMKSALTLWLREQGHAVHDLGTHSLESCDYPDYANALAEWMKEKISRDSTSRAALSAASWGEQQASTGGNTKGILICGSGTGMAIAANRHAHIRAALVRSGLEAKLARAHNDANVLCLGARITGIDVTKDCITQFLTTEFEGGRHAHRVHKLS